MKEEILQSHFLQSECQQASCLTPVFLQDPSSAEKTGRRRAEISTRRQRVYVDHPWPGQKDHLKERKKFGCCRVFFLRGSQGFGTPKVYLLDVRRHYKATMQDVVAEVDGTGKFKHDCPILPQVNRQQKFLTVWAAFPKPFIKGDAITASVKQINECILHD